jgi:UDPglucose 6-dehydrogenase
MCSDGRIGKQFLYPGLGYGGSCFPKDVLACISMGAESNAPILLLEAVNRVNQRQRGQFLKKIDEHFSKSPESRATGHGPGGQAGSGLKGRRIAIWGIAFKPGTDDVREAPSITVIQHLLDAGAMVLVHDPVAHKTCRQLLGDRIEYVENPLDALDGAEALVICTDWDEFRHPDFDAMVQRMKCPVIFDGRNLYRRETMHEYGFTYYSVGRAPVSAW